MWFGTLAPAQHAALSQHSDHVLNVLYRMKLTSSSPAGKVYLVVCKGNRNCDEICCCSVDVVVDEFCGLNTDNGGELLSSVSAVSGSQSCPALQVLS